MAKSLQEQLLEAGALKKDRATRLKKEKHKKGRQQQRGAGATDHAKLSAQQAQAQKVARDRELNQQQQAAAKEKAIAAQVRQLIESNIINADAGDIAYNFTDAGVIRKVFVDDEQQTALVAGRIALVRLDQAYRMVPAGAAKKIAERDPDAVVVLNTPNDADKPPDDDPYAEFQVPDDLTW